MSLMKSAFALASSILIAAMLPACQMQQEKPTSAQIEAVSMKAAQQADASAERKLISWSAQQLPVAQRELGLLFQARAGQRQQAVALFEQAAQAGDTEAAFRLAEMLRNGAAGVAGVQPAPAAAAHWYAQAAQQQHARAALMLGLLYKNGEGVTRDEVQAAHWLGVASELGNPHAMFLLSYIYREGRGVSVDRARARQLLEEAAEHEYPPAIQELAITVQIGDGYSPKDALRASHLLKEATEHRQNNWNRF